MKRLRALLLASGALCAMGLSLSTARAADNCTGYDILFDTYAETVEVAKDHTLTVVRSASVLTSEDTPAYQGTTGECSASFLATPDGKARATGHCARRDKDNDTYSIEWALPAGADKGTWKSTGGTGKFAGKQNSGWFQEVRRDGKMTLSKWGGTCK
jgi:hypothetical protein